MSNNTLLIIDPQVDFCHPQGSLYVSGAEHDMYRLTTFIQKHLDSISSVHVTLDSHQRIDIAHPLFWKDAQGTPPPPFTQITADDVYQGIWTTQDKGHRERALHYLKTLEEKGRYLHFIWPEHCLLGTSGHTVDQTLNDGLQLWENHYKRNVRYVLKGLNPFTEHFSAVQAEVIDETDPHTQVNSEWISELESADTIWVAGEASSHCVAHTVRDLLSHFTSPSSAQKVVLLTDTMSPVAGFEAFEEAFYNDVKALGVQLKSTQDIG